MTSDQLMNQTKHNRLGSAEIASLLRRDITTGELLAHERLPPERALAEQYGVARGTIREALNRLADESLVAIKPGSGTYVTFDPASLADNVVLNARPLELIDARFALEPHVCRLAVLHARQNELEEMERLLVQMEASEDNASAFSAADTAFHTLLAESTGNSLLIWIVTQINAVRNQKEWSSMRSMILNADTIRQYNAQHRDILNAIREREPEKAASVMKVHLEAARLSLTRSAST